MARSLRDFDINIDGMAHYGLLPDLLQDMRNSGMDTEDFIPLFRSAYDYVLMWDACRERSEELSSHPAARHAQQPVPQSSETVSDG